MTFVASARRRWAMGLASLLGLLFLAACGTVSKEECQVGDWRSIGLRDGREGRTELFFAENAKSCERYGIAADRTAWLAGRAEGLKDYCTPISGWSVGRNGRTYENVCSGRAGEDFLIARNLGSTVREAREAARRYEEEARSLEARIRRDESDIVELRTALDAATPETREEIRRRLAEIEFARFDRLNDRFAAERAAARARFEADQREAEARAQFTAVFGVPPG